MSENRTLVGSISEVHHYAFGPSCYAIRPDERPHQTVWALWTAHAAIPRPNFGDRVLYRKGDSPLGPKGVKIWEQFWEVDEDYRPQNRRSWDFFWDVDEDYPPQRRQRGIGTCTYAGTFTSSS